MNFINLNKRKIVVTHLVAIFFIFFWVNGPLSSIVDIQLTSNENTDLVKPILITDREESHSTFDTIGDAQLNGDGFAIILDEERQESEAFSILQEENKIVKSSEYGDELMRNAKKFFKAKGDFKLLSTEDFYYASIKSSSNKEYHYFQSKGLTDQIKGYSGPINIGVFISEDGTLAKMVHVNSSETESYLRKITKTHYYTQYEDLSLYKTHELDGISGATVSSKAMATTTTALIELTKDILLDALINDYSGGFEAEARLSLSWVPHLFIIFLLFLYAIQKKLRKSKRYVLLTSISCVLFIGFYLNDSFTYITFMHPFIGTSISSFMGIYALFVLLGAIWGKNTYCKYICPYGNIQKLQLKIWKGGTRKFPISNVWIKRIRFFILIFLIAGILAGFRNLSHLEPYPYIFGFEIRSIWYFSFALFALVINWIYPMIWCRLLCPTGSVLDTIASIVELKSRKK